MADLKSDNLKMLCEGFALGVVNDLRPKNKFNFLQNIRVFVEGILESRPPVESYLTLNPDPGIEPHDIKTILNEANDSFLRIVGAGTKLFTGNGAVLLEKDSGFSGKALSMIDFRPEQSVEAYLYIADENKFVKISVSDILSDVGIIAPTKAAVWNIVKPEKKTIDKIDLGSDAAWNNLTGSAGAPSLQVRVDTTVNAYLADDVLPNFVSIMPVDAHNILKGSIVDINGLERIVEDVFPASISAGVATISKISYDFGVSGPCTIVLSVSNPAIVRNSILFLNGLEYVRVEDVTRDSNNVPSIRVTTAGTFAAGDTITGVDAFRVFTDVPFGNGNTIKNSSIKSSIAAAGISSITRNFNIDLTNTGTKPLTDDDILHISISADPTKINEIQIQLAVDGFDQNYFYYPVTPNFFTESVSQATSILPILQQTVQRQQLLDQANTIYQRVLRFSESGGYDPGVDVETIYDQLAQNASIQTATGQLQWSELNIRLGDFIEVGTQAKNKKDIIGIRVSVNAKEALDIYVDSIWVGGSGVLDSIQSGFLPYNYVWRIRDPATRARSNWSPPLRTGIKILRGGVSLTFPDAINYPTTYKIDVARFGGSLSDFRIVGSILNDGNPFIDLSSDRLIADNELAGRFADQSSANAVFDFYKPFAVLDTPKNGVCNVIGTKFTRVSGDHLDISYPRGVQIVINGIANSFYTNPIDDGNVELERDMGELNNVPFEIQEPLLTGQPLPCIFGPTGEGNLALFIFGIGYKKAAGTVYWLDGNSPDTQSDLNSLEITSPSEPLVAGVIYDGYPFIWSTARSFTLQPTISSDGTFSFIARENANSRGLYCRTAICVGPSHIFFLSENADGIYRVQGNGNPECITNGGLSNLFCTNGKLPEIIKLTDGTQIYPPDFTKTDDIRFFSIGDYTLFRFIDTNNKPFVLVFSQKMNDFVSYDTYKNDKINAFYKEELVGNTQVLAGISSGVGRFGTSYAFESTAISRVLPFSLDGGDSRFMKEFKEIIVDVDPGLVTGLTIRNFYNNGVLADPPEVILGEALHKRDQKIINLQSANGAGKVRKNISTTFQWLISAGVKLYEEKIYYIPKADEVTNRSSDIEDGGDVGNKLWQGVIIKADTFGQDKLLHYYDDQNNFQAAITINHNGEETKSYSFPVPFMSHTIRRTSFDSVSWLPENEVYVFDREPESAEVWMGEFNTHDLTGLIIMQRMGIAYRSQDLVIITLRFEDNTIQQYTLPNTNGQYNKEFFFTVAKKWKACQYKLECVGGVQFYKKDSEVWMRSFSSSEPFRRFSPFGGDSRITEIMI